MASAHDEMTINLGADTIVVGDRMRELRQDAIPALMESIKKIGQQIPIVALQTDPRGGDIVLVAGAHRLEALRRLDKLVKVRIFRDEKAAKLWEISENFHRTELTINERAAHFAAWEDLTKPEPGILCAPRTVLTNVSKRGQPKKDDSLRSRAERANVSQTTVRKFDQINRGEPPAAPKAAPAPPKQAPAPKSASNGKLAPVTSKEAAWLNQMVALWREGSEGGRAAFREHIA